MSKLTNNRSDLQLTTNKKDKKLYFTKTKCSVLLKILGLGKKLYVNVF